jgi:hypothetical protein
MRYVHTAFLATAVCGLVAMAAPASAQVYLAPDGHYYKIVPVKRPVGAVIPAEATASVDNTSGCRLDQYVSLEYQPKYVTMCGPQ